MVLIPGRGSSSPSPRSRAAATLAIAAAALLAAASLPACAPDAIREHAAVANAIAIGANQALPLLAGAYQREGDAAIAAAPDRAAAEAALAQVRARWRAVWGTTPGGQPCGAHGTADPSGPCVSGTWPAMVAVDGAWATRLEHHFNGEALSLADATAAADAARAAYCALRASLPAGTGVGGGAATPLPDVPGAPCGGAVASSSGGSSP